MCSLRKERLQEAHQLQLFRANQRLLLGWSVRRSQELQEKLLPNSRAQALDLLQEHQDTKVCWEHHPHHPKHYHHYHPQHHPQLCVCLCVCLRAG